MPGLSARGRNGDVRQPGPLLPEGIHPRYCGNAGWKLSASPALSRGHIGGGTVACGPRAKVNLCSSPSKILASKSVGLRFLIGWVAFQP